MANDAATGKRSDGDIHRPMEIHLEYSAVTDAPGDHAAAGGSGETLWSVLREFVADVLSPRDNGDGDVSYPTPPITSRLKSSCCKAAPRLPQASRNSARDLVLWTRRGSALRALLVISVGTIVLLSLTGLLVFMFFLLTATINAIIISLLISLAVTGGFLALFFACLTAIYIGALSVAIVVISTTTISTVIAVFIATGWIGFVWVVWVAAKKSLDLTKQSLNVTATAVSSFSASRNARRPEDSTKSAY